jgi:pimeloyl-ACP methyl ester carboxylesterase
VMLVSPAHPFSTRIKVVTGLAATRGLGELVAWIIRHTPRRLWGLMLYRIYARASRALPGTVEGYGRPIVQDGTTQHALRLIRCWQKDFDDLERELANFPAKPVLIVWGQKDKVVPYATAKRLAKCFHDVEMITIPDCGHVPYEEMPERFNQVVSGFLARVRQQKAAV